MALGLNSKKPRKVEYNDNKIMKWCLINWVGGLKLKSAVEMGKELNTCDESALIHAFDNALSKYKVMHNQGEKSFSTDGEEVVNRGDGELPTLSVQSCAARSSEKDAAASNIEGGVAASNIDVGVAATSNTGNYQLESADPDINASSMNGQNIQSDQTGILDTQSLEDYNQVLSRYYELEDQRQKVLLQLSQFGYWDYQNSNATEWGHHTVPPATTASQEYLAYATQHSCSNVECTCCPYWCQLLSSLCTSSPSCGLGAASVDNIGNPTSIFEGKNNEQETKFADTELNIVMNVSG